MNPDDELPEDEDVGQYDDPSPGYDVAQAPQPMDPVEEFGRIMQNLRVPMEVKRRIQPLLEAQVMQQAEYDKGLQQMAQRQQGLRSKATSTKEGFYAEIDKPLPINAAKMALNKATGYFAQALAPKGDFKKQAEDRRTEELGEIKARRLQRLRGMEAEALSAAKRADEMDDVMEKEKAFREAEKLQQQIGVLAGGMKDYNALRDKKDIIAAQSTARQDQIRATWHGRALTTAGKLDPTVSAQLKLLKDRNDKEIRGIDDQLSELKNNFDMNTEQREKARQDLLGQRQGLIESYMDEANQLMGTKPAEEPTEARPAIPRGEVVHDIVINAVQADKTPAQLQKIMDDDPAALAEDFGLDPADTEGLKAAKGEVMTMARRGHKIRMDIASEVRALNSKFGAGAAPRKAVDQARMNKIQNLNIELMNMGLPPVEGVPGDPNFDSRNAGRAGRVLAGQQAREARAESAGFKVRVPLN